MADKTREISKTGFYHVMVRGVNRQKIFCDNFDRKKFLSLMKEKLYSIGCEIHAFCLMENHVHILIKAEKQQLSEYMQHILSSYGRYFNKKTNRVGHLFQNRFKSEPVNDEAYFLTVLRYILQNPEKAFICKTRDYQWSSYSAYGRDSFVATEFAQSLFSSQAELKRYLTASNNDECLDLSLTAEENDIKSKLIIDYICRKNNIKNLADLSTPKRNFYINEMKKNGITIRRISKYTGLSRGIIEKA